MTPKYQVSVGWNNEESAYVREKLIAFNLNKVTDDDYERISIILKDDDSKIVAGVLGWIEWGCFQIEIVWVDEALRGEGLGRELMQTAEQVAGDKGCHLIKLDTFNFQAPIFYQKLGYEIFGKLEDFPKGYTQYYLCKRILK